MNTALYIDLTLLAAAVVYVVDVSGWTDSWRSALQRVLGVRQLRALPPFDCGKCATFWAGIIYALATRSFSFQVLAFVCALSLLSQPMGEAMTLLREALSAAIAKLLQKL